VGIGADLQVDCRPRQIEVIKELPRHGGVIVLSGVDDYVLDIAPR
jgi:hypothetical protein